MLGNGTGTVGGLCAPKQKSDWTPEQCVAYSNYLSISYVKNSPERYNSRTVDGFDPERSVVERIGYGFF